MAKSNQPIPTFTYEEQLWASSYQYVAGIDEAGRGALVGPVVAAAVIVPAGSAYEGIWTQVRDSKTLKPNVRTELYDLVQKEAAAWGIGSASPTEIDTIGIAPATQLAMQRAVEVLDPPADSLLIDWVKLPQIDLPQESIKKADLHIISVAAASILAKVYRDRLLVEMDKCYPQYGFGNHKGYGTAAHLAALAVHGPCPEHRHSFAPVKKSCKVTEFQRKELKC